MKSYYYSVVIKVKNKIHNIIEYNEFERVANFVHAMAKNKCDKHYDCTVELFKNYVSTTSVLIASYKMRNREEVVRAALMTK